MNKDYKKLKELADKAFNSIERSNRNTEFNDCQEYFITNSYKNTQGDESKGNRQSHRRVFCSDPIKYNGELANIIHSTLTNPATRWSNIMFTDDMLNNDPEAVMWMQNANEKLRRYIQESNFDAQAGKLYPSFTALGNMQLFQEALYDDDNRFTGLNFTALHIAEVCWAENTRGEVDRVYRKFKMTASQLKEKFPDTVSEKIEKASTKDPHKEFVIYHIVMPRNREEVKTSDSGLLPPEQRPIASYYILECDNSLLEEGGYYEMPIHIVRGTQVPGEVYGRGPGSIALADTKSYNKLRELMLKATATSVKQMYIINNKNILGDLDLRDGGVTYVSDTDGAIRLIPKDLSSFNFASLQLSELSERIKQTFYLDKLVLPPRNETGEMSAFEVSIRVQEVQKVIGPMLGKLLSEFLQPLVLRAFKVLLRNQVFGELPPIIQQRGLSIDIEFLNPLARGQKSEEIAAIRQWMDDVAVLAQANPQVLDYVNVDAAVKHIAKIRGVPVEVVTNDKEVMQIREARQQQQAQQQALQAGVGIADITSKMS